MRTLSKRQSQLLEIVTTFTDTHGYAPSLADMATALDLSQTRAYQLALKLETRGRLAHTAGVARSWRVAAADAQNRQSPTAWQTARRR